MDSLTPEELLVAIGRILFERRLTDISGGNISTILDDKIYITPRFAGSRQHWYLDPQTIIHAPVGMEELLENQNASRESRVHLEIYQNFPDARAIIHSHPFHVMPFCAAGKPILPVLEASEKLGVIDVVPYAPAHSTTLAVYVREALKEKAELITRYAAGVLLTKHGLVVVSTDLLKCLDAVERIDTNAWCILAGKLIPE